jgi:DNA-binding transcriptional MerR regulator
MPIQKIDEMREQKKQKSVSPQLQCLLETEGQQIAELMDLLLKKKEDEAKSDPEMETKILLQEQKDKYKRKIKELKLQIQNRSQLIDNHCPPFYTISSTTNNRGYAVIINNFNFTSQAGRNELKLPNKSSSELDEFNIIELFGKCLGYQPVVYCNVNHSDISNGIRRYTNAVKDNQDSFVCFILSWGHGSYFYSSDGILTSVHEDVLPHLDTPSLQGKPKIIFVCTVCPPEVTKEAMTVTTTPTMADVLLVCATLSPQTLVEKQYGSPYIETLFQVLFSNCSSYDLVTILTMVNEEVIKNGHDVKQVIASSLTKQMVFLEKNPTITLKNNSSDSFDNQIDDLESAVLDK